MIVFYVVCVVVLERSRAVCKLSIYTINQINQSINQSNYIKFHKANDYFYLYLSNAFSNAYAQESKLDLTSVKSMLVNCWLMISSNRVISFARVDTVL